MLNVLIEKHHFFELNRKMMNIMWRYLFGTKRYIMRFTPRLTWVYAKTNSNLPIYSYDKNQILFEVSKSF